MSSNHVPHHNGGLQGKNMFAGDQFNGYDSLFPNGTEQTYGPPWTLNPTHPDLPRSHSASLQQTHWQQNPLQRPSSSSNPPFDSQNELYQRSFSRSPAPFQHPSLLHHGGVDRYQQPQYDPDLGPAYTGTASGDHIGLSSYSNNASHTGTISPQALQNYPLANLHDQGVDTSQPYGYSHLSGPSPATQGFLEQSVVPRGEAVGQFLVIDPDGITRATHSRPVIRYLSRSQRPCKIPNLHKAKLPNYVSRKSRNERTKLFPDDSRYTTKVTKKRPKATKPATIKSQRVDASNAPSSSESESPDDSEYDSSDSEFEATDPSPLASTRPMNPKGAVEYDSIKALWRRSSAIDSEDVRKGLGEYWEVVRTIRDRWKTDGENVKQAMENKKLSELPLLKSRVQDQCDMIEVALKTAIKHGNTMIVENFGLNAPFLFLLYQFLIDRSREGDYDGELSRVILEILSLCTTLTNQALEKTYLAKVLPKFAKRGDTTTMALVKRITDAASAGTRKSAGSGKIEKPAETKTKDVKTKSPPSAATPPSTVIGVKRPRPGDASTGQPPKRVASGGVPSNPANPGPPKSAATQGKRPVPVVSTAKALLSANATITAKPKAQQVVAKSPSLFSSLQSASKRPGTSNAVKAAVVPQKAAITGIIPIKKSTTLAMPTTSSSKPAFSFAETMANLTKPKEPEPTIKPKEETPVETEETRVKRLRKEERRKLRVSWKPEANLVEVRLFTHDPEEELGHDDSMVRDVGDVGGEGRMFKQHKDMIEVDEEDTDGLAREETFLMFTTPTLIDFSVVDLEERERNYSPYGGGLKEPESAEREVQERHEASTLMVFYAHPSDIPPCPREPADPYMGEPHVTNAFGKPPDSVLARESLLTGSQAPVPAPAASDISALLNALTSQQAQQAQQTQQQQPTLPQTSATELERIFATFAAAPPQPQAAAAPAGHTPQPAQAQPDISAIMAAMQTQPPTQQQQQPQPQPSAAMPAGQLNLSAIMASLGQGGMPQMPSMPVMPGVPGFTITPNPNPSAQPPSYNHPYENEDRKRYRENDYDYDGGTGVQQGGGKRKKGGGKKFTLPCKYWKQGKCQKGDACTYVHE